MFIGILYRVVQVGLTVGVLLFFLLFIFLIDKYLAVYRAAFKFHLIQSQGSSFITEDEIDLAQFFNEV
jgi:hypothetical protein